MPGAVAVLDALSWDGSSAVDKARGILGRARAVEHADIASQHGRALVLAAMRENDVGFARMLLHELDLGQDQIYAQHFVDGIEKYGDEALDVIGFLITSGRRAFGLRCSGVFDMSPLLVACWFGRLEVVKLFIRHGAPLNSRSFASDGNEVCPAAAAIFCGHDECLRELLQSGADPHIALSGSGHDVSRSLLRLAVEYDRPAAVSFLLRAMANRGSLDPADLGSSLCKAVEVSRSCIIPEMLINAGASLGHTNCDGDEGPTPFFRAAVQGNERIARYLSSHGSSILKADSGWDLWWDRLWTNPSTEQTSLWYIRFLLRMGFTFTQYSYGSAWVVARRSDSSDIANYLLRRGPGVEGGVEEQDELALELWLSVLFGKRNCVDSLVARGVVQHEMTKNVFPATSLSVAMLTNEKDIYGKLVRAGAKMNCEPSQELLVVGDYFSRLRWFAEDLLKSSCDDMHFSIFKDAMRFTNIDECRCDMEGSRALHLAAKYGQLSHAIFLLDELNADVNVRDDLGRTPLMRAVETRHQDTALRLARARNVDFSTPVLQRYTVHFGSRRFHILPGSNAFHLASLTGRRDVIDLLEQLGADVEVCDERGRNALWLAIHDADCSLEYTEDIANLLLALGVPFNSKDSVTGIQCTHAAAKFGLFNFIELLSLNGVDVNAPDNDGNTTLHWIVLGHRFGSSHIVKLVQELGADVDSQNAEGETALHIAARYGALPEVEKLIAAGAGIDPRDALGRTPLMVACTFAEQKKPRERWNGSKWCAESPSSLNVVHTLLKAGTDTSCESSRGLQALHFAAANGQVDCCRLLALHLRKAKLDARSESGLTPLHLACRRGHSSVTELLLDAGVEMNRQDNLGRTALYHAATKGHVRCVSKLLLRGADASLRCSSQLHPLAVARRNGHARVAGDVLRHTEGRARTVNRVSGPSLSTYLSSAAGGAESGFVGGEEFWTGFDL